MRAVVQRVISASVDVGGERVAEIANGLLVLLGVADGDDGVDAKWMAEKVVSLRIFEDDDGKMNLSIRDVEGSLLAVSQFTLLGDCRKGRRPSFVKAARPELAEKLYSEFINAVQELDVPTQTGRFQTHMSISLVNDGPVTIIVESPTA